MACGLNYKTAPIELRERFYFSPEKTKEALLHLTLQTDIKEAVILSTCNRTEIYYRTSKCPSEVSRWLSHYHDIDPIEVAPHLYIHQGEDTIRHVFGLAAGLDSMILGEPEIFGQLKKAVLLADQQGTLGSSLRKLFNHSFLVGKKIRTQTGIGKNTVSFGKIIIQLAREVFTDLSGLQVLLIGSGDMIESIIPYLKKHGIVKFVITSRTVNSDLLNNTEMNKADIIITATNSPEILIKNQDINNLSKKLLIDLSIPRNIDPEIKNIKNMTLYSLDDLKTKLDHNKSKRHAEIQAAQGIIDVYTQEFILNVRSLKVSDTLKKYHAKMNNQRDIILDKIYQELKQGKNPEELLKKLAYQLTRQFLHEPSVNLKKAACQEAWVMIHAAEHLLGLGTE